jgi:hypothetical protein
MWRRTVEALIRKPNPSAHAHHWLIDEANGPLSAGRCKTCGERKSFRNWIDEPTFVTRAEEPIAA